MRQGTPDSAALHPGYVCSCLFPPVTKDPSRKGKKMTRFNRITINPALVNGQPCLRGMRLTVKRVVEVVALYPNRDELFLEYPELDAEDVRQALDFAACNLDDSVIQLEAG
jgi:uncharacterized protein (DUF433 family)